MKVYLTENEPAEDTSLGPTLKLLKKLLKWSGLVLLIAVAGFAILISYERDCPVPESETEVSAGMRAVTYRCYGSPDVLEISRIGKPVPGEGEILVRVVAAGVNPLDWHYMRGSPYVMRLGSGLGAPADTRLGVDFAGVVESVGTGVQRFKPGDQVFGGRNGAFADYVLITESSAVAQKPDNISFEQAAAVGIAGVTALQALQDKGQLAAGQKVLINGASGGVGTFALQMADAMGAEVTGVSSARNHELVRDLGADHVIDYKTQDYTKGEERYDLIVDMAASRSGNIAVVTNDRDLRERSAEVGAVDVGQPPFAAPGRCGSTPHTHFPGEPVRPLRHLSVSGAGSLPQLKRNAHNRGGGLSEGTGLLTCAWL